MKIREQFKKDLKKFIKDWSIISFIIAFFISVCYSYMHFLIDILRLPLLAPEKDGKGEFIYFWTATLYSLGLFIIYIIIDTFTILVKKLKNYVFE